MLHRFRYGQEEKTLCSQWYNWSEEENKQTGEETKQTKDRVWENKYGSGILFILWFLLSLNNEFLCTKISFVISITFGGYYACITWREKVARPEKRNFKRCRFSSAGNVHLKIASPRFPPIRFICNALLRHMYKPDQQKYKYEDKDINRTWYPNNHRDLTKKRCLKKCTLFRMRSWKRLWSLMSAVRGKKYLLSVTLI